MFVFVIVIVFVFVFVFAIVFVILLSCFNRNNRPVKREQNFPL